MKLSYSDRALSALGHEAVRRYYEWQLLGPHDSAALLAEDAGVGGASSPSPAWDWVAYTAVTGEQSDIYVVGSEGGEPINITNHPANDYFAAWSPCLDGSGG